MPDFSFEQKCESLVCGLDEVGRAPLAGPVVAACVIVPVDKYGDKLWESVNDSKAIAKKKRGELAEEIKALCTWGIAEACPREVESLNIVQASFLAMRRAYELCMPPHPTTASLASPGLCKTSLRIPPPGGGRLGGGEITALIDGHILPKEFPCPAEAIVKGDSKSVSIAAASILAKVYRDALMERLCAEHPHYGWERNSGYPTPEHLEAIDLHGITDHHRRTFAPVKNYIEFGSVKRQLQMAV